MPFNSGQYFLFLPVVYLVFYFTGVRARWFVLLASSFLFYSALNAPYLPVLLLLSALMTYGFGRWLGQAGTQKAKRYLLWSGISANILILVVMKYLPFLSDNLNALSALFSFSARLRPAGAFVAIGVSFYVFQAISYLIDVYLEVCKPERHFGYFALYLAFFPKLLQGPIERAGDLIPQLKSRYEFNYDNVRSGILLFAWGLFKKIVIADRLGIYVDGVYNDVHAATGLPLLLATYAYAFQIYMDFSGYTDMALGSARLFNIKLTRNFNSPYLAVSVADFWRRWHISFSSWILDYIFKPLQMQWRDSRNWGVAAAIIVTFLVSGLWHGASWGFMVWGALHGVYLACSVFYRPFQKRLHKALGIAGTRFLKVWQILVTVNLVSVAWVFFRADSCSNALYVLRNMFDLSGSTAIFRPGDHSNCFFVLVAFVCYIIMQPFIRGDGGLLHSRFRWVLYYALFFITFYLCVTDRKFIYFQF